MTDQTIVWMWQHYSLRANAFDTLDEALAYAYEVQENGDGSLSSIETASGRVGADVIDADCKRRDQARRAAWKDEPKMTHAVKVTSPEGKEGWWDSYPSEEAAMEAFDALPPWLRTTGRARIEKLRGA